MAIGCSSATLSSLDARCETATGGIKSVMLANFDDIESVTVGEDGIISAITLASDKKFAKWQFRKNTGSYTSTYSTDDAVGNSSFTTEVSLQFTKAEAQKRMAIQTAINAAAVCIVEDYNGNYIYLGKDNYVSVTAATMVSGTANSDLNGFTLTFSDLSAELPHFVDSTIISGLLTA